VTVWLAARNNPGSWLIGIVNNIAWLILFFDAGLFADAGLQVAYMVISVYGWFHWLRGGVAATPAPITHVTRRTVVALGCLSLLATTALSWFLMSQMSSTLPIPDAFTTVMSLAATWLLARRHIESWPLWIIAVNVPFTVIYLVKELPLTASLQLVYIALSASGWLRWRREMAEA
jgi:nicotinamide mononucleotide transporter